MSAAPRLYLVEQFATVVDMEGRVNDLALKPLGERYEPISFTETTENFTVLFALHRLKRYKFKTY